MSHSDLVESVAFSPDGQYAISGDAIGNAIVWEAMTGKEISSTFLDGPVYESAFSPDGKYVVTGGGILSRVWNPMDGKEIASITHNGTVLSEAFSPDGKFVISGDDKTARIWDAMTGVEAARFTHDTLVSFVEFSPDGKYALSGGYDRTARVWSWRTDDLIQNACDNLPRNLYEDEWKIYLGDEDYQEICPGLQTARK